ARRRTRHSVQSGGGRLGRIPRSALSVGEPTCHDGAMKIPFPLQPMLAKAVKEIPTGEYSYEPKWDGFRCLVVNDAGTVRMASRGGKDLAVYFPELVEHLGEHLPAGVVLDGELVVRIGEPGAQRLDWDSLTARIHPAASRVERLAAETPAEFIAFDQL